MSTVRTYLFLVSQAAQDYNEENAYSNVENALEVLQNIDSEMFDKIAGKYQQIIRDAGEILSQNVINGLSNMDVFSPTFSEYQASFDILSKLNIVDGNTLSKDIFSEINEKCMGFLRSIGEGYAQSALLLSEIDKLSDDFTAVPKNLYPAYQSFKEKIAGIRVLLQGDPFNEDYLKNITKLRFNAAELFGISKFFYR
jgi:hypothetical protein